MTAPSAQASTLTERRFNDSGLSSRAADGVGMRRAGSAGRLHTGLNHLEARGAAWLARHGILLLRTGLGVVFLWFGVLKFFPGMSAGEDLAGRTIAMLTLGLVPLQVSLRVLAATETLIGLGLISGRCLRATLLVLLLHMLGTLTPLLLFPALTFAQPPYAPTLEGQYILKNIVFITAALVIGATVRGGRLIADPERHTRTHERQVRWTSPRRSRAANVVLARSSHGMSSTSSAVGNHADGRQRRWRSSSPR